MNPDQKIEVLKQAVAMATVVLADRNDLVGTIAYARQKGGGEKADRATAVVDHFFQHFYDLVSAE